MGHVLGGGAPKAPPIPAAPPPAAAPSTLANPDSAKAGASQRQRAAAAVGTTGQSGSQGLSTPPQTANVTLLGG